MDRFPEPRKKSNFGMKCIKYLLLLINVLYLIISFLMISGATTLKVIFGEYYFILWYSSTIDSLSSLWIATGCFLLALSIFGIVAAVKESTLMTNVYGLFLSLIFILQMASAITGFTLITQSNGIVSNSLHQLMYRYPWENSFENTMDWVQSTFACCGNEGPFDWRDIGRFSTTPKPYYPDSPPYYTDSPPWWYSTYETTPGEPTSTTEEPTTTTEKDLGIKMPQSCCKYGSSYDNNNLICDEYFTRGCQSPLQAIVSESVMMIGSSALIIGVVQILGVVCAFMYARTIRRSKTNRDVQKWAIHQSMGFDRPAYADQVATPEIREDEIKHI